MSNAAELVSLARNPPLWEPLGPLIIADGLPEIVKANLEDFRILKISGKLRPATDAQHLYMRFSSDNGVTWDSTANDYHTQTMLSTGSTVSGTNVSSATAIAISPATVGNAAGVEGIRFEVTIDDFNKPTYTFYGGIAHMVNASNTQYTSKLGGRRVASIAMNAFQIYFGAGNTADGYATIEGMRG